MQHHAYLIANYIINYNLLLHRPIHNQLLRDILNRLTNRYQITEDDKESIYQKYHAFGRDHILGTQPYFDFDDDHIIHPDLDTVNYDLLSNVDKQAINQAIELEVGKHQIIKNGNRQFIFY